MSPMPRPRFQVAEVLPDKSSKSVIQLLTPRWLAMFGAPRVLVADQGREFVSWEMEEWASSVSTMRITLQFKLLGRMGWLSVREAH